MEGNQGLSPAAGFTFAFAVAGTAAAIFSTATGCGLLETTDPEAAARDSEDSDDSGDEERRPEPWDDWLAPESIAPDGETLSPRPTLQLRFNAYLQDDAFRTYNVASLRSGGLAWGGWTDYSMVDKTLLWTARGRLPAGLEVKLRLSENLESVTGAPLRARKNVANWRISADAPEESGELPRRPTPRWPHIRAIFEERCTGCHGDPQWGLNPLTYEALVGGRSDQVDALLVRPFDAPDSYLMHKLLWDYPVRRFQPQPPPWSQKGTELPKEQLRMIEAWIDAGAPR